MTYYNSQSNNNDDTVMNHHGTMMMGRSDHGDGYGKGGGGGGIGRSVSYGGHHNHHNNNAYHPHQHANNNDSAAPNTNYFPASYSSPPSRTRSSGGVGRQMHHQHYGNHTNGSSFGGGSTCSSGSSNDGMSPYNGKNGASWHQQKNFDKQQHERSYEPLTGSSNHNKQYNNKHMSNSNHAKGYDHQHRNNNMKDINNSTHSHVSTTNGGNFQHSYKKPVMPNRQLYLAMECNMVGTVLGDSFIARVVLIDWKGRAVLDTFVNPTDVAGEITDYRTQMNGGTITPEIMDAAPSFASVRTQVLSHVQDKIIVGHSIDQYMKAFAIDHPWTQIRDTAFYQPFMKEDLSSPSNHNSHNNNCMIIGSSHGGVPTATGPKFASRPLKELAKEKLQRDIQTEEVPYCPIQDAMAALDLYKSHRPRWEACIATQMQKEQRKGQNPHRGMNGGTCPTNYNCNNTRTPTTSRQHQNQNHRNHNDNGGSNEMISTSHHSYVSTSGNYHYQQQQPPPIRSVTAANSFNGPFGSSGNNNIPSDSTSSFHRHLYGASSSSGLLPTGPPGFSSGLDDSSSLHSASSHHNPGGHHPHHHQEQLRRSVSTSSTTWGMLSPAGAGAGAGASANPTASPGIIGGGNSAIILSSSFHSTSSTSTAFGGSSFHNGDCGGNNGLNHHLSLGGTTITIGNTNNNTCFQSPVSSVPTANKNVSSIIDHDDDVVDIWSNLGSAFESNNGLFSDGGDFGSVGIGSSPINSGTSYGITGGVPSILSSSLHGTGGFGDNNNGDENRRHSNNFYLSEDVLAGLNALSLGTAAGPPSSSLSIGNVGGIPIGGGVGGGYMNPAQLYGKGSVGTIGGKKLTSRLESASIFPSGSTFSNDDNDDSCSSLDGNSFHDPSRELF